MNQTEEKKGTQASVGMISDGIALYWLVRSPAWTKCYVHDVIKQRFKGRRAMDMLYVALGDSVTCGLCASSRGYVTRIQSSLANEAPVHVWLQAKIGWTSKQLLMSLMNVPDYIWTEARLVTIMVGGNDLLKAGPWLLNDNTVSLQKVTDRLQKNLNHILQLVHQPETTVILATLYNPFPHSVIAQKCIDKANHTIRLIAQREDVKLSDVQNQFFLREHELIGGYRRGQLRDCRVVGNPIHPNDAGHELIATEFLRAYHATSSNMLRTDVFDPANLHDPSLAPRI